MAKVEIIARISGSRDGVDWPAPGEVLVTSDVEAAELVSEGIAKRVEVKAAPPVVEVATARKPETAARKSR